MRQVKSKKLKVISICSECGEQVAATTKDNAFRHGFNRFRTRKIATVTQLPTDSYSQEDGKSCPGSGQPVAYKRKKK